MTIPRSHDDAALDAAAPHPSPERARAADATTMALPDDLAFVRCAIVNVVYYGRPGAGDRQWVLIDTGMPGFAGHIAAKARERYGDARPAATRGKLSGTGGGTLTIPFSSVTAGRSR